MSHSRRSVLQLDLSRWLSNRRQEMKVAWHPMFSMREPRFILCARWWWTKRRKLRSATRPGSQTFVNSVARRPAPSVQPGLARQGLKYRLLEVLMRIGKYEVSEGGS